MKYMLGDKLFWKSIQNTLYYTVIFVPIAVGGSLALAMLLNQKIAGRVALRTLYFLPSVTPVVAAAFPLALDLPAADRADEQHHIGAGTWQWSALAESSRFRQAGADHY